jgi:ketosteroid isomerase-like protein
MNSLLKTLSVMMLIGTAVAPAQKASPLSTLVTAELSFARTSDERGMDSAFIAFLAADAVIFRPHPVNGQDWFRSHSAPPILLTWTPGFAEVSVTGELGYTTGPWMARAKGDTAAPAAYGDFVTIWKKKGDAWKVKLDLGISHPAPVRAAHLDLPADKGGPSVLVRPDSGFMATEWSKLREREKGAFGDSLHPVPASNFIPLLGAGVRILRPGHLPIVGSDSVRGFLNAQSGRFFRSSLGGEISRGADLGYTYGAFRSRGKDQVNAAEGYYLTIWKKEGKGDWKIALDLQAGGKK